MVRRLPLPLLLWGCGLLQPRTGPPPAPPVPPQATVTEYLRAYHAAWCGMEERCAGSRPPLLGPRAECDRWLDEMDAYWRARWGTGLLAAYEAHLRVEDPNRVVMTSCANRPTAASCDARYVWWPFCTEPAVTVAAPAATGAACGSEGRPGPWCEAEQDRCESVGACSTCVPWAHANGPCRSQAECYSGACLALSGSTEQGHCDAQPVTEGRSCHLVPWDECGPAATCVTDAVGRHCRRHVGAGQACAGPRQVPPELPRCQEGTACVTADGVTGTCEALLEDGEVCFRSALAAPCRRLCVFAEPGAGEGTCAPAAHAPAVGQACARWRAEPDGLCAAGDGVFPDVVPVAADGGVSWACTCDRARPDGAACHRDSACVSGHCAGTDGGTAGTCGAGLPDGAPCTRHTECAGGACRPADGGLACTRSPCASATPDAG